jgi:lysophospholipase L1-like esterase
MTWPDLVVQRLRHDYPGTRFDYVNGGVAGYKTSESLANLRHRVGPLSPDVIIIYHATNDLASEVSRLATAEGLDSQKRQDWLEQHSLAWHLIKKNALIAYRSHQAEERRDRLQLEEKHFSLGFEERLSQLIVESKKRANLVAIATFSYKVRQDQTPEVKAKNAEIAIFYMPSLTPESLLFGYQEFNRVIDKLALDHDLVLVQGELDIPADDQHFADTFHFRDLGNRKMAERVSSALASSPEFVRLVKGQELDPTIHLAEEPPHSQGKPEGLASVFGRCC